MTAPAPNWRGPEAFDEYRLVRPLGRGAMGEVWVAEDKLLDRLVAIKFVGVASPSAGARERFFTEARAIARVSHPNVVAIHRVSEVMGRPFLVSEYVRGESLKDLEKPLPWAEALRVGIDLARGLSAAHRRGVLHRDIKPANAVIAEDGTVKLLDFGLAELLPEEGGDRSPSAHPPAGEAEAAGGAADATISLDRGDATVPAAPKKRAAGQGARAMGGPVGTPLYMAPEVFRGEVGTAQADIYSMGVLLFELCAGRTPHEGQTAAELSRAVQSKPAPPLIEAAPSMDARLAAVVDRCLEREPSRRFASGDALREALERIAAQRDAGAVPKGNPYRGLMPFETAHRALFFGRGADVRAIVERLRSQRFVLVTGDSGIGKSSLCRAGVLPAIAEQGDGAEPVRTVGPLVLGRRPVEALAAGLAPLLETSEAALTTRLRDDPASLGREIRKLGGGDVVVFIDQMEELGTLAPAGEAALAGEVLGALVGHGGGVRLLGAARIDFIGRLAALPGIGEELSPAIYLLRQLSAEGLHEAIVAPAEAKNFTYESEALVETLAREALEAPGGLPLLQFALAELWEARDEGARTIPAAALDAMGGVAGALARHADGVVAALLPDERAAAQSILLSVLTPEGTRARMSEAEIVRRVGEGAAARRALEALVRGRLIVAREASGPGSAGSGAYEIAHEALVRSWDTLRAWQSRDAEARAVAIRVERAAAEWERLGRSKEALWSERQLSECPPFDGVRGAGRRRRPGAPSVDRVRGAGRRRRPGAPSIDDAAWGAREGAFLSASRRAVTRRKRGRWALLLGVPLAVVVTGAGVQRKVARDHERQREEQIEGQAKGARKALGEARQAAQAAKQAAKQAYKDFDKSDPAAESHWRDALALFDQAHGAYARADHELEAALLLAGGRWDVRGQYADVLFERAVFAEGSRRLSLRDELVQRLEVHDEGEKRLQRLQAPARIRIQVSPPDARVQLFRFDANKALMSEQLLGPEIDPGSVLLRATAPRRATVRVPLLVRAGQVETVKIALPPADAIPDGFVYIRPGWSLFGSTEDEQDRILRERQPIHPVKTDDYLIERHEVTFAQWIEFLRTLPAVERRARTPSVKNDDHDISLNETGDGRYRLVMRPTTVVYSALEEERIRYQGRDRNVEQDWRLFPVTGISYDDALAYTSWLDRTGRVPGARLCTEHEWERAARGADDRLYPGGDTLAPDDANYDVTYGRVPSAFGPDEVGSHPRSRSPFGIDDMAGNAWEWVQPVTPGGTPSLRSGCWYQVARVNATINREPAEPTLRSPVVGLRVCATPGPAMRAPR